MRKGTKPGRLINVLMKDGKARRVPRGKAEDLLDSGRAVRYISNTVYRAMQLGIEVKDHGTKDLNGKLRAKIAEARQPKVEEKPEAAPKAEETPTQRRPRRKRRTKKDGATVESR